MEPLSEKEIEKQIEGHKNSIKVLRKQIKIETTAKFIFILPIEEHEKLLAYAKANGMHAAEVLRRLIKTLKIEE